MHRLCILIVTLIYAATPWMEVEAEVPQAASFGQTRRGESVEIYTLANERLTARVTTYGATLVELHVPDRDGRLTDVVLGWDDVAGYESAENQYFGCTTGRVCNRIASGKFRIGDTQYTLAVNNPPNHLHGGVERSLDKVVWQARPFSDQRGQGVEFSYLSPDGEEGYPGNLQIKVTYLVPPKQSSLKIIYQATSDQLTPVNLTNHAYFNLGGAGSQTVLNHRLRINADHYTPVDDTLIPTGQIASVEGTPVDFRKPTKIGRRIEQLVGTATKGYDHNFVLNAAEEGQDLRLAAILTDPQSGRRMRVSTTEPGVQFYSGNFLMGQTGKQGQTYPHQSALCLETQHYPDSVNHPHFPSTLLHPGKEFKSQTVFAFSVVPSNPKEVTQVNRPVEVDVKTVKSMLDAGQIVLIDCREPGECEVAKIDGAVLLPLSQWAEVSQQLKQFAGKPLVVHCHHGGRSLRVTRWLRENGFPEAQNMTGGIDAWSQEVDADVPRY